jgi:hypothetical protein
MNGVMGIIFTGIEKDTVGVIRDKMSAAIAALPDPALRSIIRISSAIFPDDHSVPTGKIPMPGASEACRAVS